MHGLADGLDPDSAYLTRRPGEAGRERRAAAARRRRPRADASVLSARHRGARQLAGGEGRPADRRLHPRHQRHADARDVGVGRHARAARRRRARKVSVTVIRGNAADPHVVELTRETEPAVRSSTAASPRRASATSASPAIGADHRRPGEVADRRPHEGRRDEADRRRAPRVERHRSTTASRWRGCSSAKGTLAIRETKGGARETIAAAAGDGAITLPTVVLIDTGTSAAAEIFAAALVGQQARRSDRRAHDRPRRVTEAGQAAGRHRPVAVDDALSHAGGRAAARKRARADRRRSTSPTSSSASRRRRPIRSSTRRSNDSRRKKPRRLESGHCVNWVIA